MTAQQQIDIERLATLKLAKGSHKTPQDGVCLMEAVAWVRGIAHTDHPPCVCPVLGAFGRRLNDRFGDEQRQELIALIPALIGTADDGLMPQRMFLAVDWVVREVLPKRLRMLGLEQEALSLESLNAITNRKQAGIARDLCYEIRKKTYAAAYAADADVAAAYDGVDDVAADASIAAAYAAVADVAAVAAYAAAAVAYANAVSCFKRMIFLGKENQ